MSLLDLYKGDSFLMLKICTLASGSDGNSTYISDGKVNILIDAGISARRIVRELGELSVGAAEIDAVFVTHEHADHVCGLRALFERCGKLRIFASAGTARGIFEREPTLSEKIEEVSVERPVIIGDMSVVAFKTSHDTYESVAYRIESGGKSIAIATDLGVADDALLKNIVGTDVLLLEANYDERRLRCGRYPEFLKKRIAGERGHLSNKECARCAALAAKCGTSHVILGHLSAENNTPNEAYTEVHSALTTSGIIPGVDIMLRVAPRGRRGELVTVGD